MGASCTKAGREEAAFLKAAKDGDCRAVQQAIMRNVDWACKVQTWNGQSVFHLAARYGRLDVLETVVEAVRFNPAGPDKWEKLLRMGHSTNALLRAFANLQDARCQTPLHLACIYGHQEVAERLLELGGTPWAWDELGGRTPLHYAASMGHVDVIRVIISHSTPAPRGEALRRPNSSRTRLVDICNDLGYTPLHYAVWAGNLASVRALTSYEASLSARNVACGSDWVMSCLKCTPLHLAAHKGNQSMVKLLLSAYVQYQPPQGADAPPVTDRRRRDPRRHVNANRQLPYHVAVARNHTHLTEMLHPDVPFSFILTPAEMESRLYGVPKLAVMAAKTLQTKLVADIECALAAMAAAKTPSTTGLLSSGGAATGMGRMWSGSLAVLSGAVVAAATGQSNGNNASAAAQQVLAAATARLRSVTERSLHGSTAALQALEATGLPPVMASLPCQMQQQQRPASIDRLAAGAEPLSTAVAQPRSPPVVAVPASPGAVANSTPLGTAMATASTVVSSTGAKLACSAPSEKSSATSAGDSERDALALGPAPDLNPRLSVVNECGGVAPAPALPLPPAPISPFLPAPTAVNANDVAVAGTAATQIGRVATFNEAASAFALFAAEPFEEPGGNSNSNAQALQPAGSSSVSLAMLARNRAQQTASGPQLPAAGNSSVSVAMLARGKLGVNGGPGIKSRSLRSLLTGAMNRRSNTNNAGGAASSAAGLQQQQQQPRSELSSADDLAATAEDALDDLDDILNAMQPPEDLDGITTGVSALPLGATVTTSAAAVSSEEAAGAAAPQSAWPSASQASQLPARVRGTSGGGSRPFWRRISTQVAAPYTTWGVISQPTQEAGSSYNVSLHAGLAANAGVAPPETLQRSVSARPRGNSLPAPAPPGVIESRGSLEASEVNAMVGTVRGIPVPALPIDSNDDESDAALQSGTGAQSLRPSSISQVALARGGAEAVLQPSSEQEPVDGAVLAMLTSLVEAPQHVLRRYRLLQLTHGLDLQDLLRDHSEQAAAAAAALATAPGFARPSGLEGGQPLQRVRSDARTVSASLVPQSSSHQVTAIVNGCQPAVRCTAGDSNGEDNLHGPAAVSAIGTISSVNRSGRTSVDSLSPGRGASPGGVGVTSPFANEATNAATLTTAPAPSTGTGLNANGVANTAIGASANAASANLAGQLLRTLSSAAASESGEGTCGVCFDQPDVLSIIRCGHRLCTDCSKELCKLNTFKPALCPFCRGMIGGFTLIGRS